MVNSLIATGFREACDPDVREAVYSLFAGAGIDRVPRGFKSISKFDPFEKGSFNFSVVLTL